MVSATISLGSSNRPSTLARFSLHRVAWSILKCARPTRARQFSIPFFNGVAVAALYCAHWTSTVSSCAFCEQEGHLAAPSHPSEAARCASTEAPQPRSTPSLPPPPLREWPDCRSLRIERAPSERARSASKKDIWPLPLFLLTVSSQSSHHLRLLPDLPHGTPLHRVSLSSRLAMTL
jgi:hypothetical protein